MVKDGLLGIANFNCELYNGCLVLLIGTYIILYSDQDRGWKIHILTDGAACIGLQQGKDVLKSVAF